MRAVRMCLALIVTATWTSVAMAQEGQGPPPPNREDMRGPISAQPQQQEFRRGPRARQFEERSFERGEVRPAPQPDAAGPNNRPQRDGQPQWREHPRKRAEARDGRGGKLKQHLKRRMLRRHLMQQGNRPFVQRFHQRGLRDGVQSGRREFQRPGQRWAPRRPMMQDQRGLRDSQRPMPHTGTRPFGGRFNQPAQPQHRQREMRPDMRERFEQFRRYQQGHEGMTPRMQRAPQPIMPPPGAD